MPEASKETTQQSGTEELIPIFIMGRKFEVPPSLTIQKAMEYAGYQLIRGCGCRGGICGACATVFRTPDSYQIQIGLACQTLVQPNMYLSQIPFFPANKATYDLEKLAPNGSTIAGLYPEIFKCIGCGTCTRSCPMDIEVMEYISEAIRGNVARVAELSFDCVMCGLCAARCPAEEVQYNVAILCRRLHGRHNLPKAEHLGKQVDRISEGTFKEGLEKLKQSSEEELKKLYVARETEPDMADEMWEPKDNAYL